MSKKISDLTDGNDLAVGDLIEIARSGNSYKLDWGTIFTKHRTMSNLLQNHGIAAVCGSNALTISLKQSDGVTDPAVNSGKVCIAFRSSTLTSGGFTIVECSAAVSTVISSGSTAGHFAAKDEHIYVYALNVAGAVELAWSSSDTWDEGILQTTTAEGGAGAADSKTVLYSTTQRTNVPIRLLARITIQQATPGTWVTNPSIIQLAPYNKKFVKSSVLLTAGNGYGSTNTKIRRYTNNTVVGSDITYADSSTAGMSITINKDGYYSFWMQDFHSSSFVSGVSKNSNQLTTSILSITDANILIIPEAAANSTANGSWSGFLSVGDVLRVHTDGTSTGTTLLNRFYIERIA